MKTKLLDTNPKIKSAVAVSTLSLLSLGTFLYANGTDGKKENHEIRIIKTVDGDTAINEKSIFIAKNKSHDGPVKLKIIRIADGDTTVTEKTVSASELDKEEGNLDNMKGKKVKMMMFAGDDGKNGEINVDSLMKELKITCKGKDGKTICKAFTIGDGMKDFKWTGDMYSAMKSFNVEFNMDSLMKSPMGKAFKDNMGMIDMHDLKDMANGFSYDVKDDGKNRKIVVKTLSGGKSVIIKGDTSGVVIEKEEDITGNGNDDVVININNNSSGKSKQTKIIISSRIKMEDMDNASPKSPKKNELKVESLDFYPNPSSGKFNLEFEVDGKEPTTIKVTDINGKEVYKEMVTGDGKQSRQIDIGNQTKGIYILNLTQGKKATSKRIIIE